MSGSKVCHILSNLNRLRWNVTYKGILGGVISGLLVSLYRFEIEFGAKKSMQIYGFLRDRPVCILPWLLLLAAAGFIAYRLIRLEPYAKGSGIPQVEGIVLMGMKMKWYTILAVRFAAGMLASLFGLSLGREGPSIQIGACGSQAMAERIGKNKLEENYLITAGASAGLSAAFNAPLSGIMFALEEIHRNFSPNILIAATTAALTADVVSKYLFGLDPVLGYLVVRQLPIQHYVWVIPLGILSGVMGALTNKGLLRASALYKRIPAGFRPAAAMLVALPCGLLLPQVLGGGEHLIKIAEGAQTSIAMMTIYLMVKLAFTCTSFGSGMPGGIFMPILSIGALTGGIFGQAVMRFGLPPDCIAGLCVCAMAGVMSGSVKAPVTSILLMTEMTGSLVHLLPVAAAAFIALLTSDLLKISPIYEVLLERMVDEGGGEICKKKAGAILEVVVEMGSEAAGKQVRDVAWPEGALIVSLLRGKSEMVPNGCTRIVPGDYLVVLSSEHRYEQMNRALANLCRCR